MHLCVPSDQNMLNSCLLHLFVLSINWCLFIILDPDHAQKVRFSGFSWYPLVTSSLAVTFADEELNDRSLIL